MLKVLVSLTFLFMGITFKTNSAANPSSSTLRVRVSLFLPLLGKRLLFLLMFSCSHFQLAETVINSALDKRAGTFSVYLTADGHGRWWYRTSLSSLSHDVIIFTVSGLWTLIHCGNVGHVLIRFWRLGLYSIVSNRLSVTPSYPCLYNEG